VDAGSLLELEWADGRAEARITGNKMDYQNAHNQANSP
jgi:hypothetical protein